ncbi:MAG: hypothetical protein U9R08_02325 [Nanoarchaeota archaeon]|nr:hypothetical protein [Nanoarchaeota archaeon]
MKKLTNEEINSLNNLNSKLIKYKKQISKLTKEELQNELEKLNNYLKGCRNSEIDDTLTNIRFIEEKINVLKNIIHY